MTHTLALQLFNSCGRDINGAVDIAIYRYNCSASEYGRALRTVGYGEYSAADWRPSRGRVKQDTPISTCSPLMCVGCSVCGCQSRG
jgi:hypothetical protein